jgi:hypothetical protein
MFLLHWWGKITAEWRCLLSEYSLFIDDVSTSRGSFKGGFTFFAHFMIKSARITK